ncbi:cadherin-related family member 2 isoform X2 [Poeciliopsis prolifica]|uniref:cadherin-related family member 2 isoform X2 n=1 Tax=Poeciliopsis prolifica TaxID=188132 RepID=UPI0024134174|nr:cadherin-related family member 2 isoform X2 [Poeciliopsis prolifica]
MGGLTGWLLLLCLVCSSKGSVAFTILASDPEGDTLTYALSGINAGFFEVNSANGQVTVTSALDRETMVTMGLGVSVSDGSNTTPGTITLILLDANDNSPVFENPSFDITVPENTAVGSSLFKFTANDRDESDAGVVRYSITEIIPPQGVDVFEINDVTGELKLKSQLNYNTLSTFYRLKVQARDLGGSCTGDKVFQSKSVFSFVTVEDVPDLDPVFIGGPYVGSVEENSPADTSVLRVFALDEDKGINDDIIYSIEASSADGLFKISTNDGIISVSSGIDREVTGDKVTLTVKGTESKPNVNGQPASATATVEINIGDVNDNPPQFYKCEGSCVLETQFTGDVFEHSLGAISIGMTVKDPDKSVQTELRLEGEDKDVFSVEHSGAGAESTVQLLVRQPENLDYEEKQQMVLQVIAVDKGKPTFQSTATVTIIIKDTNDNSPTFPQDTYKISVAEHSPVGTEVKIVTADDPDTMDAGNITYSLLPESILQYFDVEQKTGKVYVKNQTVLDRELRSLYSATLQARDTDGKPGTAVLEITLTDINDQPPIINRETYQEFVDEGGKLEFRIEATDGDEAGTVNSQIEFSIKPSTHSSSFSIDPNTGVFTNNGELDREALDPKSNGRINLTVIATDKGTPALSSSAFVIINVVDINDNGPTFKAPSYNFSVKEGEKGASAGLIYAEDLDQTAEFNRISFSIIDGSFGSFIVRTSAEEKGYSGNIMVDPDIELDYETAPKKFTLRVEAADLELEKASTEVVVNVLDVNDERPEFTSVQDVSVAEDATTDTLVGTFVAQDKDTNHSLVYELESVNCKCSDKLEPCSWFTLEPNGDVRVGPTDPLDYEQCDQAVVKAQVVDLFTEKGENNSVTPGEMVISIKDINDNSPEFIYSDAVYVVVSESASKGTSVAGVTASDKDSGENRVIKFNVDKVQFENRLTNTTSDTPRILFEAVTTQQQNIYVGIIQTTEGLDLTLKGKYLVTVSATDTGGLSSTTVLEIFTIDEGFRTELQFRTTVTEVEQSLSEIKRELSAATGAAVDIVSIRDQPSTSRNTPQSFMVAYFIFLNGTALTSSEVEKRLSDQNHFPQLYALGLINIGSVPVTETKQNPVVYGLLGVVGGFVIILVVLTTSLLCTRRNYRRKLKAANAMKSATMLNSDNQKGGAVVPGTNKYTMEGANPVLNLNIPSTIALDLDLNDESSDADKSSLNSLDHHYDIATYEHDTDDDKKGIMWDKDIDESSEYNEPLGAALAQLGQNKKSSKANTDLGVNNPMFNSTDL